MVLQVSHWEAQKEASLPDTLRLWYVRACTEAVKCAERVAQLEAELAVQGVPANAPTADGSPTAASTAANANGVPAAAPAAEGSPAVAAAAASANAAPVAVPTADGSPAATVATAAAGADPAPAAVPTADGSPAAAPPAGANAMSTAVPTAEGSSAVAVAAAGGHALPTAGGVAEAAPAMEAGSVVTPVAAGSPATAPAPPRVTSTPIAVHLVRHALNSTRGCVRHMSKGGVVRTSCALDVDVVASGNALSVSHSFALAGGRVLEASVPGATRKGAGFGAQLGPWRPGGACACGAAAAAAAARRAAGSV